MIHVLQCFSTQSHSGPRIVHPFFLKWGANVTEHNTQEKKKWIFISTTTNTLPFFTFLFDLGDLFYCSVSVQVDASCASYSSGTSHQSGPGCRWCGDGELWGERTRSSIHLEKTLCVSVFVSTCVLYQGPLFCWLVFPALSTWFAAGRKS